MKRYALGWSCLLLVCLAGAGCGPRKVKVHGKLTCGPTALKGAEREPLIVTFSPYREDDKSPSQPFDAEVDQDKGTYEVVVPVGKYRICVSRFQADLSDQFNGAFTDGVSPIIRDVKEGGEINVDLKKPKG